MAREGIYIGGREIIERYVGDKLVWQKWKWRAVHTTTFSGTPTSGNNLTVTFETRLPRLASSSQAYTRNVGYGAVTIDGITVPFSSVRGSKIESGHTGGVVNYIAVTLFNETDKNKLLRQFNNKQLIIYERYK